jgi:hypothetical protein
MCPRGRAVAVRAAVSARAIASRTTGRRSARRGGAQIDSEDDRTFNGDRKRPALPAGVELSHVPDRPICRKIE